jgi:hypothetical protein
MHDVNIFLEQQFTEIGIGFYAAAGPLHGPFQVLAVHIAYRHQSPFALEMVAVSDATHPDDGFGDLITGRRKPGSPEHMTGNNGKSTRAQQAFPDEISSFHRSILGSEFGLHKCNDSHEQPKQKEIVNSLQQNG